LATGIHTGFAAGDEFLNVEVVQGSAFADTFVGNATNNIFIGGAGADSFDGAGGYDSLWYISSTSGVTIDLSTGTASGGDAAGDTFVNIETVIGSNYNDTLTAVSTGSILEGAGGSDIINGGVAADVLYGGLITDTGAAGSMITGDQADTIHGGAGNDRIYSAGNSDVQFNYGDGEDSGSHLYGDAGADTIIISSGTAYGGTENDTITVWGTGIAYGEAGDDILNGEYIEFHLYGGDGSDRLNMKLGKGSADGGNGGDIYHTDTILQSTIHDTGTGGSDYVYLDRVVNLADLVAERDGNDLVLGSQEDKDGGITYQNSLVILEDWYSGGNTIEFFVLADGTTISGGAIA
jgi:Ca2+-binding RTX toxin-like protein